jgi:hypothetical protein
MKLDWIDCNKDFYALKVDAELKSGMVLEYDDGTYELVGDINECGGYCDCCSGPAKIVKRYAVIGWKENE